MAAAPVSLAAIIEMSVDEHTKMAACINSTRGLTTKAICNQTRQIDLAAEALQIRELREAVVHAQVQADATELRTLNTVSHNISFARLSHRWEQCFVARNTILPNRTNEQVRARMHLNQIVKKLMKVKDGRNRMLARLINSQKALKAVRTALVGAPSRMNRDVTASAADLIMDSTGGPNHAPFEEFQYLPAAPDAGAKQGLFFYGPGRA